MGTIRTVTVRGVEIGAGMPKVIVPIVGATAEAILAQAREILHCTFDIAEWRVDFCEALPDRQKILAILKELRTVLGETPLLATIRTKEEGGARDLDRETYTALNAAMARSGDADLVDVQIFDGDKAIRRNIEDIHAAGCLVVGSYHNFGRTPDKAELIRRMCKAQELGADIPKIAVMPRSTADVITLLDAAQEMRARHADRPAIALSMGHGVISRLSGECFGSDATFGMAGQASAPGQIPVDQLTAVLAVLHQALSAQD